MKKYAVVIEETKTGYAAYAPDLPGLGVTGKTVAGVARLIREGIEAHIEILRERGEPVPKPRTRCRYVEAA
ncbi:MAG: type II toxin-antitoxin system HicB family antitoxin [Planctomycetes bacterium]|nr:type II toxin-antitoxin system HicB family antitoxin [Planctomycetota bacterium]